MKYLVVVDMQNDFVSGALGSPDAQAIVPGVVQLIERYKAEPDSLVTGTLDTHTDDYLNTLEGKLLPVPHCIRDTEGWKLHPDVATVMDPELMFEKPTFGSLDMACKLAFATSLLPGGLEEIALCGLCTDICVVSNALLLRATFPDVPIKVYANCCAGTTPEKHESALQTMESCQIEVIR